MSRTLSEAEFNRIKQQVYAALPVGLTEAEFNRRAPSALAAALAEAENVPAVPEGSAASRFASNLSAQVNPVAIARGLYESVKSPEAVTRTLEGLVAASKAQGQQALQAGREGRYVEALGHGAAMLPLIGPAAAAAGEQIASGDIAGGLGTGTGLIAATLAPSAAKAGMARLPSRAAVAEGLQAGAESRVASVMAPAGRSKTNIRMGNKAAAVAPELLKEADLTRTWTREGLHQNVSAAFDDAAAALDAAHDARLSTRSFDTKPLVDALLEKRRQLTSEAIQGSGMSYQQVTVGGQPATTWIKQHGPLGGNVVPGPNAARVAQIDQAIAEIRQLGPLARYEPLRVMRAAYDIPAEVTYNPSVTADFLTKQGGARGAADVTGVLRDFLAKHEPATATANARFSLMKSAQDVLAATAELERVRPAVGRRIMQSFVGSVSGGAIAGLPGVAVGAMVGPVIDAAMSAGLTTKLQTARLMQELATALRNNNPRAAASVGARLRQRVPQLGSLLAQQAAVPAGAAGPGRPEE